MGTSFHIKGFNPSFYMFDSRKLGKGWGVFDYFFFSISDSLIAILNLKIKKSIKAKINKKIKF